MSKINLKIKRNKGGEVVGGYPLYPTLHLSDIELPVGKDDIDVLMRAKITLKLVDYGEDNSTKGQNKRYGFAIKDIEFVNGSVEAVKKVMEKNNGSR